MMESLGLANYPPRLAILSPGKLSVPCPVQNFRIRESSGLFLQQFELGEKQTTINRSPLVD
jgi:hypothetical protein